MSPDKTADPVASVVIITLGRPKLYQLLPALDEQDTDFAFEIVLVANGPVDTGRIRGNSARVYHEEGGLGIPYYRNRGTELALGRIIVFIDDDEMPKDKKWLDSLVNPILSGGEKVTVAGTMVPLGQGFLADLISMLGYPGGGSLGWRNVYKVDENGYTDKLPSGNCAIEKTLLEEVGGFHEDLVYGASDLFLGETLLERGVKMLYVDDAEICHEARGDLMGFISWQIRRGRSVYNLKEVRPITQFSRNHVGGRLKRTWLILKSMFPSWKFIPMLGVLFIEYFCHGLGYLLEMIEQALLKNGGRGRRPAPGRTP